MFFHKIHNTDRKRLPVTSPGGQIDFIGKCITRVAQATSWSDNHRMILQESWEFCNADDLITVQKTWFLLQWFRSTSDSIGKEDLIDKLIQIISTREGPAFRPGDGGYGIDPSDSMVWAWIVLGVFWQPHRELTMAQFLFHGPILQRLFPSDELDWSTPIMAAQSLATLKRIVQSGPTGYISSARHVFQTGDMPYFAKIVLKIHSYVLSLITELVFVQCEDTEMGFSRRGVKAGDEVVVFDGATSPFIIRKIGVDGYFTMVSPVLVPFPVFEKWLDLGDFGAEDDALDLFKFV